MNNQDAFDATQRVYLDADGHSSAQPRRTGSAPRPTPSQRAARKRKQRRNTLILLGIAAVLLIAIIVTLVIIFQREEEDNGLILKGVSAAGVDLSNMTPEQAKAALKEATDNTYSVLDMTVSVLDTTITLSPADTGARLDVDAVVAAAFNYGRTGSRFERQRAQEIAQTSGYHIPLLEHLNLNTNYILQSVNQLGAQYSTMLKQSSYYLTGARPNMNQETYDTTIAYQTLTIELGTAEYALDTAHLYQQILTAYESQIFQVTGECSLNAPAPLDYEEIYAYCGCISPANAEFNADTYEVTKEIYGYGFTLDELKAAVENADYGDTVSIPLYFVEPDIKSDFFTKDMFQDTLASFSTALSNDPAWNANMKLACQLINGTYIEPGEEFSFNALVGEPTTRQGFQSAYVYLGRSYQQLVGGGICQVASTLYYCALLSDLEILERHSHTYAVGYIQAGFDTEIYHDGMDFRFRNTTEKPIRIDASVSGNKLTISIIGTDTKTYTVALGFKIDATYLPETVYNTMVEGNPGGYVQDDVLREGITGYLITTYVTRYDKETGEMIGEVLEDMITGEIPIAQTYYAKQDQVLVQIQPQQPEIPVDPNNPGGDNTGDNPGDNTGTNPGDDTGTNPGDNTGTTPGDDTGTNPGDNTGSNPGDDTGTNPGDNTGTNPGDNTGTTPGDNTGTNPGDNTGTNPGDNTGTAPGDNTIPAE